MNTLTLRTVAMHPDGCFGVLLDFDGRPFAVTLEKTFSDGLPIIPAGMHTCMKTQYYRGAYATYEIIVAGHSRLLFHKANTEKDLEGCIGVAESFGQLDGKTAILNSKGGFEEFMEVTKNFNVFYLNVLGR